jgi:hypothetical protein
MDSLLSQGDARHGSSQLLPAVHLLWIPLGAGARVVRTSGTVYEAVSALTHRRRPCALYHSALEVVVPEGRFTIEMTPIPDHHGQRRGAVAEGAVGTRWAGRLRVFRYEIRRWRDGVIPDAVSWLLTRGGVDSAPIRGWSPKEDDQR